jgi:hypothetical protein
MPRKFKRRFVEFNRLTVMAGFSTGTSVSLKKR